MNPHADPEAAAQLLLGSCFQQAFFSFFDDAENDDSHFAATTVDTLWQALKPL